jgi:hypothetical protein
MNDTDRWLIERWEKLRQVENAMDGTRQRFESLFREVHKKVRQNHPTLDRMNVHLNPKEVERWGGNVVFSRGSWPYDLENWRTGIDVWGITLDELSSEINADPSIYIFFQVKKSDPRIETFRRRIAAEAPRVFENKNLKWKTTDEDDNRTLLWYEMPEGKKKFFKMLCDGQEQDFIDCIANHVDIMCGFIPVLDKLLLS